MPNKFNNNYLVSRVSRPSLGFSSVPCVDFCRWGVCSRVPAPGSCPARTEEGLGALVSGLASPMVGLCLLFRDVGTLPWKCVMSQSRL